MLRLPTALLVLLAAGGCAKQDATSAHAGHAHYHHHTAPHGGTLVELGQHIYALEFVRDAAAGKLSLYVLDGHAENFIRIAAPTLTLVATVGGEQRPLTLQAVANPATGETVGATAQFDAQADWLKATPSFDATLALIEIHGSKFENIAFNFPKGSNED